MASTRDDSSLGASRFLPPPLDGLSRALWDVSSFHGRRLGRALPLRVVQGVTHALENAQRPRAASFHSETADGALLEYTGHDPVLRAKVLTALGGSAASVVRDPAREPDVHATEIPVARAPSIARQGALVIPRWVELEVDLTIPETTLWATRRRETVRRVERTGYRLEVARDEAAASEFYSQMFVPTALERHGPHAVVRRWTYVRAAARRGTLLFVRDGTTRLAGLLLLPRAFDDGAWDAWLYGVRGGSYATSTVAREALYLFALRWARDERNASRLGLTIAPPFLSDGLVRYKTSWGATVSAGIRNGTALALVVARATSTVVAGLTAAKPFCLDFGRGAASLRYLRLNEDAPPSETPPHAIDVTCVAPSDLAPPLAHAAAKLAGR